VVGRQGARPAGGHTARSVRTKGLALAEAIRLDGDITVNMTGLAVIDGSCARMILDAARGLGGTRMVVLRCRPQTAARFVLLDAGKVPGVIVEDVGDA
jgi:anti-anti-sigma regulatory factor